jgi:hypothetical protein
MGIKDLTTFYELQIFFFHLVGLRRIPLNTLGYSMVRLRSEPVPFQIKVGVLSQLVDFSEQCENGLILSGELH